MIGAGQRAPGRARRHRVRARPTRLRAERDHRGGGRARGVAVGGHHLPGVFDVQDAERQQPYSCACGE